jgi:hypothetical protein
MPERARSLMFIDRRVPHNAPSRSSGIPLRARACYPRKTSRRARSRTIRPRRQTRRRNLPPRSPPPGLSRFERPDTRQLEDRHVGPNEGFGTTWLASQSRQTSPCTYPHRMAQDRAPAHRSSRHTLLQVEACCPFCTRRLAGAAPQLARRLASLLNSTCARRLTGKFCFNGILKLISRSLNFDKSFCIVFLSHFSA